MWMLLKVPSMKMENLMVVLLYAIENTQSLESTFCFGCIEDLLIIGSSFVMFLVTVLRSQSYDDHYHAYNVTRSSQQILILQNSLVIKLLFIIVKLVVNFIFL